MKTIRRLSNISYNSLDFFKSKIYELVDKGIIDYCYFIKHLPEDDELKEHIHFVFKPSKALDTAVFRKLLYEFDEDNPTKPKTCTTRFNPCNSMDDWLLYSVHDESYLKYKGQWRKYHYKYDDIYATDEDSLLEDWHNIDFRKYHLLKFLEDAVENNIPFFQLVQDGLVPIAQRSQFEYQYNALKNSIKAKKNEETLRKLNHDTIYQDEVDFDF